METQNQEIMVGMKPEVRYQLETTAAEQELSLREYIEKVLEEIALLQQKASKEELQPITREAYEGLLRLREQFKKNHPGVVLDDSTEIIRQMREERSQYLADL
jgi:hypothetical protein